MIKYFLILSLIFNTAMSCQAQHENKQPMQTITKNGTTVRWHYQNDRVFFEMNAPTDGWVTIGFNTHTGMSNAYLLMGHVINGKANVVEYYTSTPGNYKPITAHGVLPKIQHTEGTETGKTTELKFSLPIEAASKYQKDLSKDTEYVMIMAFSRDDDFAHHSMMRTAVEVKL